MEFPFDVDAILPFDVTIVDSDYRILNRAQINKSFHDRSAAERFSSIIDSMGDASYKAQSLSAPMTTARKFRSSEHRLYIVKNPNDHRNSSIVGILKVGCKHLYIYDSQGRVHERTPLCILDFYVHESKQRLGFGKRLFDTMLEFEKVLPHQLAIDFPSKKCLAFLYKHYRLSGPIHQATNFVVFPQFFEQITRTSNQNQRTVQSSYFPLHETNNLLFTRQTSNLSNSVNLSRSRISSMDQHRFGSTSINYTPRSFSQSAYSSINEQNRTFQSFNGRSFNWNSTSHPQTLPNIDTSSSWRLFGVSRLLN